MSREERYAEHTVAWELPNGDSVTKSNYNLADIETKYMPIQTEVICDDKDKTIADLEAKLAESKKTIEELKGERLKFYTDDVRRTQVINGVYFDMEQLLVFSEYVEHENWVKAENDKEIAQLKQQLAESEENNKLLEMQLQDMERSKLSWENQYFTLYNTLKNYREVTEKKHLLDEKEWQDYCAFKHIEPEIRGCLDREREYKKQLAEKDNEITQRLVIQERDYNQDKISFCIEKLEKVKEIINTYNKEHCFLSTEIDTCNKSVEIIDNQIKQLKEKK